MAEPDVQFGLAEAAVFFAGAFLFRHLTLHAAELCFGCGSHVAI
jgi:hypothetical protein